MVQPWKLQKEDLQKKMGLLGILQVRNVSTYRDELYRRVETPITERGEFIEKVMSEHFNKNGLTSEIVGEMFDAGCRFVEGK